MLKLAKAEDAEKIKAFCNDYPLGVRIVCQFEAYGFSRDFLKVWFSETGDNVEAVLCSFDDSLTLCASEEADCEEIASFLKMLGGKLCCEAGTCERLGFKASKSKTMFLYSSHAAEHVEVKNNADMKQVYALISRSIPDSFAQNENAYLSFLSDFTFRKRRSKARLKVIEKDGRVISCAITAAESDNAALISGVACDEAARGTGLGRKTVEALCFELCSEGKKVYVIALNDSAQSFYRRIGFEKVITVCYADL